MYNFNTAVMAKGIINDLIKDIEAEKCHHKLVNLYNGLGHKRIEYLAEVIVCRVKLKLNL